MNGKLNVQDIVLAISDIKSDCKLPDKPEEIDYEKFYDMVMGLIAIADRVESTGGGGTYG